MHIRVDFAPTTESVRSYAEDAVRSMNRVYGETLDFSVQSLALVDQVLRQWHEGEAPLEAITKSLYAFGSYAGEVLLAQSPGRWVDPPKVTTGNIGDLFAYVQLESGKKWFPISIVVSMMTDGPDECNLERSVQLVLLPPH